MRDGWERYGAAAGAIAIGLFVAGVLVVGERPAFDSSGAEVAAHLDENRTRIQVGCAIFAAFAPFFVWFLATVSSLARAGRARTARATSVAYGCGLIFVALFLVDVGSLAVAALRPENMAASPELAAALFDIELLLMAMAAFLASAVLVAFAVIVLRDDAIWPRWVGWLAAVAAPLYALRVGTLFSADGAFAADGILGLWVPVIAIAGWVATASLVLALGETESAR